MKALIPFTVAGAMLIVGLICLYFVSPDYRIHSLQNENYQLKSELAELKGDNQTELVSIVIFGFLMLTALFLTAFFLLLCFLSGKTPAEFFTVRKYQAIPADDRQAIQHKPTETINYSMSEKRHYMEA